jgi:hypothetical protein
VRLGIALTATGGGLIVVGAALTIAAVWDGNPYCVGHPYGYTYDGYAASHGYSYYGYGRVNCVNSALSIAGGATAFAGVATLIPGILLYQSGRAEVANARFLRRRFWGALSLRPSIERNGAGVTLVLAH